MFAIMSIVITIVAITFLTDFTLKKWKRGRYKTRNEIISKDKAQKLYKDNKRKFLISFSSFHLIDSLNQIYLIPIFQKELEKAQQRTKIQYTKIPSSDYYGKRSYNNLVLFELPTNSSKMVFDKRTCIVDYKQYTSKGKRYLFIVAGDKDTNSDGILNSRDMMDIFLYDISDDNLQKISEQSTFILSAKKLDFSDSFIIRIGLDENSDGKFSYKYEPSVLKRFITTTQNIQEVLDQKIFNQLQDLLDGKTD